MEVIRRFLRQPNQDAGKNDLQVQEEVVATESPTNAASVQEPLIVSPATARDIMFDLSGSSAEDAANIVNDLALNDVSNSPPKPATPVKRKRQEADVADESPKKRVAKGSGTNGTEDEPPTTSTNEITGHGSRPKRASSGAVKEAPGKLPRPKKEQRKRHMAQIYPSVQKSGDIWTPQPSPLKQVGKPTSPSTTTTKPKLPEATPRPRGRPPRAGQSPRAEQAPTTKMYSRKKRPERKTDIKIKPWRKGRSEEFVSPERKSREHHETPIETLPPKTRLQSFTNECGDDNGKPAPNSKQTRSSAAANGHKDGILNANIDLTKKPERDARKAAKQRKSLEHAAVSTPQVVGEEHEGEDDEDKLQRRGRRDPEEAIDRDAQTSVRTDEGEGEESAEAEEEDADSEDPTQVIENDEEEENEVGEELELFGQDEAWKTVLEGARSICGPKLPLNHMPKLLSKPIKSLINEVREARSSYEQLLSLRGIDHDSLDGLNDQLRESLDEIEDQIRSLSEQAAATRAPKMIRDIYARAIPAMVFLLQSALVSRMYHSDEPCELETLNETVNGVGEIVRLQKMAIFLCEKAKNWKAKPVTSRPIVRPTTKKIFPCLRNMREAFSKILVEQNRKRKGKQNAVDYTIRQKELAQQAKQDAARKPETLLEMIRASREQEDETRRIAHRTFRQIKEDEAREKMNSRQVNGHVESRTTWSNAEDLALYFQLEKGYAGGLTTEERYLNILNAPLLQNKLPEHIRERALYFKSTLLEEKGALEWISSIE